MSGDPTEPQLRTPFALPRGGLIVLTSKGPVQFGMPPETIKDTLVLEHGVPEIFVVSGHFFDYVRGVSLTELEFPLYYNFFLFGRRMTVVCTANERSRIKSFMQESVFGPEEIDLSAEIDGSPDELPWYPVLEREMAWFRKNPIDATAALSFEDVLDWAILDEPGDEVEVHGITLRRVDGAVEVIDPEAPDEPVTVTAKVPLPSMLSEKSKRKRAFRPPVFGVTVLGSGHGFDPASKTTGFVLWTNGRGLLVDPPVDATEWLLEREIPSRAVDAIILTHCHADHDAGTLQKALQAARITVYTTPTIFKSFLRKSEAIVDLPAERFETILDFRPVPIRTPVYINGARFVFDYTLHSIPTIRFQVWLGGKSLVYSADTLNEPDVIRGMAETGVLSKGRAEDLLDYPWHHDLVIHEAGVPPIHTAAARLALLPDDVKERLLVVHTTKGKLPKDSGLKIAPLGLSNTVRIPAARLGQRLAVEWLRAMRSVEFFSHLSAAKAEEFLELVRPRTLKPGTVIIEKGTSGSHFYMILSGKCGVYRGEASRKIIGMYDYFGEASLVADTLRTADVVAISEVKLLEMDREAFLGFLSGTDIRGRMARLYRNRDENTWQLLDQHPVLARADATQRTRLQSLMVRRTYLQGEVFMEAGNEDSSGYIIVDGEVEERVGGMTSRMLGRGDLGGDLAAICEQIPSLYSLGAAEDVIAYELPHEAFRQFLLDYPGLFLRLIHHDD